MAGEFAIEARKRRLEGEIESGGTGLIVVRVVGDIECVPIVLAETVIGYSDNT